MPNHLRSLGRSSPNFATCLTVTQIFKKIRSEIWVASSPRNLADQKRQNFGVISDNFATSSRISLERNKTSSVGKRRCKLQHSHTGVFNLAYFGPQMAKTRTGFLTHPTGGHQAGHNHASSCLKNGQFCHLPLLQRTTYFHNFWQTVDYKKVDF